MHKIFIITIFSITIVFLLLLSNPGQTTVGGDCDACHNVFSGMMEKTYRAKPFQYVLKNKFCVNCHSNENSDTIKILGGNRVPIVHSTVIPFHALAGGNFYYVARDFGDRKGHNVDGVTSMDTKFRGTPPGYNRASDPSIIGYNPGKPLTCAGSNGCHGDRNIEDPFESVFGTHHAVDKPVDGSTTAKSYRFLKNTGKVKGILGLEDPDWNQNVSSKKHNEYDPSIDFLCESCHADFHDKEKMGKESPWFRHPTGIPLPGRGEYADYKIYDPDAPVARQTLLSVPGSEINHGTDIVICLSCHAAHASPYESMLRWDYDNVLTEGKGGCLLCHVAK